MKPKIAPTSPKTAQEHREFEQFYTGGLQTIEKPRRLAVGLTLLLSFGLGVAGTLGALAGLRALSFRFGTDSWVRYFLTPVPQQASTVLAPRQPEEPATVAERAELFASQLVGIYQNVPDKPDDVSELPTPERFRGNGVFVSNTGYAVTTRDVVPEPASTYSLLLDDQRLLPIEKVVSDPASPFVFLKVAGESFRSAKFVTRDSVVLGLGAVAFSRQGSSDSLTAVPVTVTAITERVGENAKTFVESSEALDSVMLLSGHDLPAGSPIVNEKGEVIGLTLARTWQGRQATVPIWLLAAPLRQLLRGTDLIRPSLGVSYLQQDRYPPLATATQPATGALITSAEPARPAIQPKSAAAAAKLKAGDVILRVDDTAVDNINPLNELIQERAPGETVTIRFLRSGSEQTVKATLGTLRP